MTPPEIVALRTDGRADTPGWEIRVVPNKYPALDPLREEGGLHEVIIESPDHDARWSTLSEEALGRVLETHRARIEAAAKRESIRYVSVWKNSGYAAGASLAHVHSQLLGLPFVPPKVTAELERLRRYQRQNGRCLHCAMAAEEMEDGQRTILAVGDFVAFAPRASRFPFETWVLPQRHRARFERSTADELRSLARVLGDLTRRLDDRLERPDYNVVLQSAPVRTEGSETYHWRFEIFPRLVRVGGLEWGTGIHINHLLPEDAARRLRDAQSRPK